MEVTKDLLNQLFEYKEGGLYWKVNRNSRARKGQEAGTCLTSAGYKCLNLNYTMYATHRLIFLFHHGFLPEKIDHINGNKVDNRIENLRAASVSENGWNAKKRVDNTSGVKGVWKHNQGKWAAELTMNKKKIWLGLFVEKEEAANAVKQYREQHQKEFARHE
jgi:hypothetical protein